MDEEKQEAFVDWVYAYAIDNELGCVNSLDDTNALSDFVLNQYGLLQETKRYSEYKYDDSYSHVHELLCSLVNATVDGEDCQSLEPVCLEIARSFLSAEMEAQRRIAPTGQRIKKGCLIQAMIACDEKLTVYIAKVDLDLFLNASNMELNTGIGCERSDFGKTVLIPCDDNQLGNYCQISLSGSNAAYFVSSFLGVVPVVDDEKSTRKMCQGVLTLLKGALKSNYPREYLDLRNSTIGYLRTHDQINYDLFLQRVFYSYFEDDSCGIDEKKLTTLQEQLDGLPEKLNVPRQFNRISKAITARLRNISYDLTPYAQLLIHENPNGKTLHGDIISRIDNLGREYLAVYTNNPDTLSAFRLDD